MRWLERFRVNEIDNRYCLKPFKTHEFPKTLFRLLLTFGQIHSREACSMPMDHDKFIESTVDGGVK